MQDSDFLLKSVLEVRFNFSTCALESEFRARSIWAHYRYPFRIKSAIKTLKTHAQTWQCCQVDGYSVTHFRSLTPLSDTVFSSSIIAIFSRYVSSVKLVKNVRNFYKVCPGSAYVEICTRNAVLYDSWRKCHVRACAFSVFRALLIVNGCM